MGLGENAAVAASHSTMVLINLLVCLRLLLLAGSSRPSDGGWLFPMAIVMYLFSLDVERLYYVVARLAPSLDLWGQHPAPAVLSAIVAGAGYWFMPPIFTAYGWGRRKIQMRCAVELAGFGAAWLAIMLVLR